MIFAAQFEFYTSDVDYRSSVLHFSDNSITDAVSSFKRWWDDRHKSVPEWFGNLWAVTIYEFDPPPIGADGRMQRTGRAKQAYNWKCGRGPYGI